MDEVSFIVSMKLGKIYPFMTHLDLKTRRKIIYSKVASIVLYSIELYI